MWLNVALLSVAASRAAGAPMLHAAHKARVTMQPSNSRAARPCRVPSRAKQLATQWAAKRCDDDERGAGGRALSEPHDATVEELDVPAVLIDEQTGRTIDCELLHTVKVGENVYASMSPRDHPVTISRYVDGELLELGEEEDPQIVKLLPTAIKACDELGMSLIHSAVSLTLAGDLDSVPPPRSNLRSPSTRAAIPSVEIGSRSMSTSPPPPASPPLADTRAMSERARRRSLPSSCGRGTNTM